MTNRIHITRDYADAPHRIYKAIAAGELEHMTAAGWTLHETRTERRAIEHCTSHEPTAEERNRGQYSWVTERRIEFGDVLVFVVRKDGDALAREKQLEDRVRETNDVAFAQKKIAADFESALATAEALAKRQVAEIERLTAVIDRGHTRVQNAEGRAQRLEGDIAKLRAALGDLRMKEILG